MKGRGPQVVICPPVMSTDPPMKSNVPPLECSVKWSERSGGDVERVTGTMDQELVDDEPSGGGRRVQDHLYHVVEIDVRSRCRMQKNRGHYNSGVMGLTNVGDLTRAT